MTRVRDIVAQARRRRDARRRCLPAPRTSAAARTTRGYAILQPAVITRHEENIYAFCQGPNDCRTNAARQQRMNILAAAAERVIMLGTPIDEDVSVAIVAQLLFLQHNDPEHDIWFYINSPGGSVRDGLAIYDTMHTIAPGVNTVCIGMAGSMATVLLAGGAKGKRYALPNATVNFPGLRPAWKARRQISSGR